MKKIKANYVDVEQRMSFPAELTLNNGRIQEIKRIEEKVRGFLCPALVDAHIHIESSMLTPKSFGLEAFKHGTIATVSDPHEIANVCGIEGIRYMQESAKHSPIPMFFGVPSCVPATSFETAGAEINVKDISQLIAEPAFKYLSEMMNWPGVLSNDDEVMKKIAAAQKHNKPVDGHAPGLTGEACKNYFSKGISTDHECFTYEEALGKLKLGVKVQIREGSAAKNYNALHPLIHNYPDQLMFCSDDKHPDDLLFGHINLLIQRSLKLGYSIYDLLKIASLNAIKHYNLPIGTLQVGDSADFIIVDDLSNFNVQSTYYKGENLIEEVVHSSSREEETINQFYSYLVQEEDFVLDASGQTARAILVKDGEIVTDSSREKVLTENNQVISNPSNDLLKICVVNRYKKAAPSIAFVKGIGLEKGAIASSVAHDSHNIIVTGTSDHLIAKAVNQIMSSKGGLCFVDEESTAVLPLPVAGLMSTKPCKAVGPAYTKLLNLCKKAGSPLHSPYMTLSFLALLVIPKLKLSDKGLFDAEEFKFVAPLNQI